MPIEEGAVDRELPDLVDTTSFVPGRLVIYGLFLRGPMRVSQVERLIGVLVRDGSWNRGGPLRLPISGSGQVTLTTRVGP